MELWEEEGKKKRMVVNNIEIHYIHVSKGYKDMY
jgi:hypothetical protein